MADGVFKRCGCTEIVDGKRRELGTRCPRLADRGHGTWWFQVDVAPAPGKERRRVRRGGFATKTAAEHERAKILGKGAKAAQRRVPNDQVKVGEFLDRWFKTRRLKPNTRRSYEGHIETYLKPHLGHLPLLHLSVTDVRAMFDLIEETNEEIRERRAQQQPLRRGQSAPEGYETRRVMGPASMQRLRATLRAALNSELAAELGVISNAASAVELPSGKPPKPMLWTAARVDQWRLTGEVPGKVMVWTPEQLGEFLDFAHVEEPRLASLYDLVAHTGMRRGEACGLRWKDVDTTARVLRVEEQLTVVAWEVLTSSPKSEHSRRIIPMSAPVLQLLQEQERRQAAEEARWGSAWIDSGRVFTKEGGEALHPDSVSARFRELVERAGLPPITVHGLRHCAATLGLAAGLDIKVVQELLGHSSHRLTADTYTSVLESMQTAAVEAISALIPRKPVGNRMGTEASANGTELAPNEKRAPISGAHVDPNLQVSDIERSAPPGTRTPNPLIKRNTNEMSSDIE